MNGSIDSSEAYAAFLTILEARGVRDALAWLVARTDYRFIGIWRFKDGKANAAVHFDKENPAQTRAQEVPESATYCCFVRDSRGAFMTAHALLDPRTQGHPARDAVAAYCGVPLLTAEGELLGTLCHYDVVPRDPEQIDLELMLKVAGTLALGGHVPPYPPA
jgi:GAF domain-containing protein